MREAICKNIDLELPLYKICGLKLLKKVALNVLLPHRDTGVYLEAWLQRYQISNNGFT